MSQNLSVAERIEARQRRVQIELPALPEDLRSSLGQLLHVPVKPGGKIDMEIRQAAWIYQTQTHDENATDRSLRRKRLRAMAKGLASTLAAHERIDATDLRQIVSASPEANLEDFFDLADLLRKWTPVFEELAQKKLPKSREANERLASCCRRLIHLHEEVTGTLATHTTLDRGGIDTGKPQTPVGAFVISVFDYIDPEARSRLNEVLRKIIWPSRQSKLARA